MYYTILCIYTTVDLFFKREERRNERWKSGGEGMCSVRGRKERREFLEAKIYFFEETLMAQLAQETLAPRVF